MFPLENFVSETTIHKFKIYESLLTEWNNGTSLVQQETLSDFYTRHILDSFQIIPLLNPLIAVSADSERAAMFPAQTMVRLDDLSSKIKELSIIDVGTGAGFPGLVLAICGFSNITLCESNFKKCIFLEEVARQTGAVVSIINDRVENLTNKFDVVISRALTELNNLCAIMEQISRNLDTFALFHKGKTWNDEVREARKLWNFDMNIYKSLTSDDSVIISLKKLKRR